MTLFTSDQWLIVGLVFLLGLVLGAALMAGGKWKRRYKEERARAADPLRSAAARDEARRRIDPPGPL